MPGPLTDSSVSALEALKKENDLREQQKKEKADALQATKKQAESAKYTQEADEKFKGRPGEGDKGDSMNGSHAGAQAKTMIYSGMRSYETFQTALSEICMLAKTIGEGLRLDFKASYGTSPEVAIIKGMMKVVALPVTAPYNFFRKLFTKDSSEKDKSLYLVNELIKRTEVQDGELTTPLPANITAMEQSLLEKHANCNHALLENFLETRDCEKDPVTNKWTDPDGDLLTQAKLEELRDDPVRGFIPFVTEAAKNVIKEGVKFQENLTPDEPTAPRI